MISQVTIEHFKRFKAPTKFALKPDGVTFLAGGHNSGKSTLLQALAVWEFARSVIEVNKGQAALLDGSSGQGVGVSAGWPKFARTTRGSSSSRCWTRFSRLGFAYTRSTIYITPPLM